MPTVGVRRYGLCHTWQGLCYRSPSNKGLIASIILHVESLVRQGSHKRQGYHGLPDEGHCSLQEVVLCMLCSEHLTVMLRCKRGTFR